MLVARPIIHSSSDIHCVATWEGLIIQLWIGGTPAHAVRDVRNLARQMGDSFLIAIVVIAANAEMPNEEARAELSAFSKEAGSVTRRAAIVFEGAGFRASAVRSIMVGLTFAANITMKYKIFATVSEGARWLAEEPTLRLDATLLEGVVRDLRRGIKSSSSV